MIGVEKLGIWSLVLATTSVTQIGNMGFSGSTIKFVAQYLSREEHEKVSIVIQTATLSIAVLMGTILLAGYPIVKWIIRFVVPPESFHYADQILPLSFFALWIMVIASVFNASLDGYQRIYIRNLILICGTIIFLILCYIFVPSYGLVGLAYAQIMQNTMILVSAWICLKKYSCKLPLVPYKWNKILFKEMIGYGMKFQIISLTTLFYEPITKSLLTKFGSLALVGYYEMANRMIQQLRALITATNQVLVPTIVGLKERFPEKIRIVYTTSYEMMFYLSLPLYSLLILCLPLLSKGWIGYYESTFVLYSIILAVGWFMNTLSGPAYFVNLGIGELRWNVAAHIVIGFLNGTFGIVLGFLYGGIGVIVGWGISLSIGSSLIYLPYHLKHSISLKELVPKKSRWLLYSCFFGIVISVVLNINKCLGFWYYLSIYVTIPIIIAAVWMHPMRRRLNQWLLQEFFETK